MAPAVPLPDISYRMDDKMDLFDTSEANRSLLTPSLVRFLLMQYNRSIKPQFDILTPEILNFDGISMKKVSGSQKFQILMACAIAAARESYKTPSWRVAAEICRSWAGDFITPIISAADHESITATLLLLIYEIAEPSRGLIWELLDIAARTCLQLGWHRQPQGAMQNLTLLDYGSVSDESTCTPGDIRIIAALNNIKG